MGATGVMAVAEVGSTILSAVGDKKKATAAKSQGDYAQTIDNQNATYADQQAADTIGLGENAAAHRVGQGRQDMGAQRAAYGASGIDANSGSAMQEQKDTMRISEFDALTIQNNAAREALGYTEEAANDRARGVMAAQAGNNTAAGDDTSMWSTILTGAAKTYGIVSNRK